MILECPECQARFKPRFRIKKEHWVGRCSHCGENVEFHIVIKKPVRVLRTKELFLVVCDRCGLEQMISKSCSHCGLHFNRHSENETITDTIYNALVGGGGKGYLKVDVNPHYHGFNWVTIPKEREDEPFFGLDDSKLLSQSNYQGEIIEGRDFIPQETSSSSTVRKKRF